MADLLACPTCFGPRLYNWVFRHLPSCALLVAEDATQFADYERLRVLYGQAFRRPTTAAEDALLTAAGAAVENPGELITVVWWRGYRHRVNAGNDPDSDGTTE